MTQTRRYPTLRRRFQAFLIDSVIFLSCFVGIAVLLADAELHGGIKFGLLVGIVLILEPGLVSVTGATVGHHLRGLRVEDAASGANLDIFRAVLRFAAKSILGLPSLLFVAVTRRHQAIHDYLSHSIVILRNPELYASHQALPERVDSGQYVLPSRGRRMAAIRGYSFLSLFPVSILVLTIEEICLRQTWCSIPSALLDLLSSVIWTALLIFLIVVGWQGRLWGSMRTRSDSHPDAPTFK